MVLEKSWNFDGPVVYEPCCPFQPQIFATCLCSHCCTPQFFSLTPSTCHHDFLDEYYFAIISCEACKDLFFLDCNGDLTLPPHIHASFCLLGDVWACGWLWQENHHLKSTGKVLSWLFLRYLCGSLALHLWSGGCGYGKGTLCKGWCNIGL